MEKIKTKLIQIGNSQGIRIPKHILERLNLHNKIELLIDDKTKQIHIKSADIPRKRWEGIFKEMHEKGDDEIIIDDSLDIEDWEW